MILAVLISSLTQDEKPFISLLKRKFRDLDLIEISAEQENIAEKIKYLNPKVLFIHYDYFIANKETAHEYIKHIPFVIFISNKAGNVLNSIHNGAFDFINYDAASETEIAIVLTRLKSVINECENQKKIKEIYSFIEFNKKHRFKTKNGYSFVPHKDILSIESDGSFCKACLTNAQFLDISLKIGKIIEELPPDMFFKIDRSTIINLYYISKINMENGTITLKYNDFIKKYKIPVSMSKTKMLQLTKYDK